MPTVPGAPPNLLGANEAKGLLVNKPTPTDLLMAASDMHKSGRLRPQGQSGSKIRKADVVK